MNDSKDRKAAAEPSLDCRVGQRIERYLRQLAPHQTGREGPTLLREALAAINGREERDTEIERLRAALREIRDCETLEAAKDIALKARTVPNA